MTTTEQIETLTNAVPAFVAESRIRGYELSEALAQAAFCTLNVGEELANMFAMLVALEWRVAS